MASFGAGCRSRVLPNHDGIQRRLLIMVSANKTLIKDYLQDFRHRIRIISMGVLFEHSKFWPQSFRRTICSKGRFIIPSPLSSKVQGQSYILRTWFPLTWKDLVVPSPTKRGHIASARTITLPIPCVRIVEVLGMRGR